MSAQATATVRETGLSRLHDDRDGTRPGCGGPASLTKLANPELVMEPITRCWT